MGLGYVEGITHDYIRHGTTTLFAALDVANGQHLVDEEYLRLEVCRDGERETHVHAGRIGLHRRVEEIAKEKKCTPSQLALAWLLAQGEDIIPIPGTKRRKYLEENVGALNVKLTPQDLRRIDEVAPHGAAAGNRYPESMMAAVNR